MICLVQDIAILVGFFLFFFAENYRASRTTRRILHSGHPPCAPPRWAAGAVRRSQRHPPPWQCLHNDLPSPCTFLGPGSSSSGHRPVSARWSNCRRIPCSRADICSPPETEWEVGSQLEQTNHSFSWDVFSALVWLGYIRIWSEFLFVKRSRTKTR